MALWLYSAALANSFVGIMIEVVFTIDEEFTMDELKFVLAYKDYDLALYDLRSAVKELWEGDSSSESIEKFVSRFNELVEGLPRLP